MYHAFCDTNRLEPPKIIAISKKKPKQPMTEGAQHFSHAELEIDLISHEYIPPFEVITAQQVPRGVKPMTLLHSDVVAQRMGWSPDTLLLVRYPHKSHGYEEQYYCVR